MKSEDERTTCAKTIIPSSRYCGSAEWIKNSDEYMSFHQKSTKTYPNRSMCPAAAAAAAAAAIAFAACGDDGGVCGCMLLGPPPPAVAAAAIAGDEQG